MGDVVHNAHGKMIFWGNGRHIIVNRLDHCRSELFGRKTVSAAHNLGAFAVFHEGGAHILVQGFADGTGLLGSVQHGDGFNRRRNHLKEGLHIKGSVQPYLNKPQAFPLGI